MIADRECFATPLHASSNAARVPAVYEPDAATGTAADRYGPAMNAEPLACVLWLGSLLATGDPLFDSRSQPRHFGAWKRRA